MLHDGYLLVLIVVNAYFTMTVLANVIFLRRATMPAHITDGPFVSVVIPARDEQRLIGGCVDSFLAQDYNDFEVVVVDDESRDATADIVASRAERDPRVRLVSAGPLPTGWLGKPHALSKGAAAARGEILIFADADTVHEPSSISWAVTNLIGHKVDLVSGYLAQQYGSVGETLVVPTMFAAMLVMPIYAMLRTRRPRLAFSIGQYVAMRREALEAVGGFDAVRNSIVDDMAMAALMKQHGFRGAFLDARRAVRCHLYTGYRDAFKGIERSVYSAIGGNPLTVAAVMMLVFGLIVAPPLSLLGDWWRTQAPSGLLVLSICLFAASWALVAWDRRMPLLAALLYPVVFANLLAMLIASMLSTGFGRGAEWKGRLVRVPRHPRFERPRERTAGP